MKSSGNVKRVEVHVLEILGVQNYFERHIVAPPSQSSILLQQPQFNKVISVQMGIFMGFRCSMTVIMVAMVVL